MWRVKSIAFFSVVVAVMGHYDDHVDDNGPEWEEPPVPAHVTRRAIPGPATVEVLAVIDYQLARQLKKKGKKYAKQYIANYYNAVNMRFRTIKEFDISVVLAGIYYCTSENDFFTKNKVGGYIKATSAIADLRKWLYSKRTSLPKHDVAMVHTTYDLCSGSSTCYSSTTGYAYISTACGLPDKRGYMWNCGIVEDVGSFSTTVIAAHELAHTLGVKHDGSNDVKACPEKDGYIMGKRSGTNGFLFSKCSKDQMKTFLEKSTSSCLYKKDGNVIKASAKYPGQFLDADEQCKLNRGPSSKSCWTDSRTCTKLGCVVPNPNGGNGLYCKWNGGAVYGTTCGNNKICNGGACVAEP